MSPAERLDLIRRVLEKAHDGTDSWEVQELGTSLAYLCLAIAEGEPSRVEWTQEICDGSAACAHALLLFRLWFPADDPVWRFILT